MSTYATSVVANKITVNIVTPSITLTLSRTGGQGAQGVSIVSGTFDGDDHLLLTLSDASVIDAGPHTFVTSNISNINEASLADGAMLLYDDATSKYIATTTLDNENTTILGGSY